MEFMDMLEEWLDLRDKDNSEEDTRSIPRRHDDRERKYELEEEINKRMRGEL